MSSFTYPSSAYTNNTYGSAYNTYGTTYYNNAYSGNTTYTGNTQAYTSPYYLTNTAYSSGNATFNGIQLQPSNTISPNTIYISGAANTSLNGTYTTLGFDSNITYPSQTTYTPTVYWETTFPQPIEPAPIGLDVSEPAASTNDPWIEDFIANLFNQCAECLGTGRIASNIVEPTCSDCNGTGKGAKKLPSNG